MEVGQERQARPVLPLREGHVSEGPPAEYPVSSKDLEAIQKRGPAKGLPLEAPLEPAAQVRIWTTKGNHGSSCRRSR